MNWSDALSQLCSELSINEGRIRVASEGINGTIRGLTASLRGFIAASERMMVELCPSPCALPDWKMTACEPGATLFPGLTVRPCKEIVTLFAHREALREQSLSRRGDPLVRHSPPAEFLSLVERARDGDPSVVLIDVRNQYETDVGTFCNALRPPTRSFSDLPSVLPALLPDPAGHEGAVVAMVCTGGVRCETAALMLRARDHAMGVHRPIVQLEGGIVRFLEAFPDGKDGCFQGRLLVFDGRESVPTSEYRCIGRCRYCQEPWDDYVLDLEKPVTDNNKTRCARCRITVLVCKSCRQAHPELACKSCPIK